MGSGLNTPNNYDSTATHFTTRNPYTFRFNEKLYGFRSERQNNGDTLITGIWNLDPDSNNVVYFNIPAPGFDKVEALNMSPDSQLIIVGSRHDSLISVLTFDSVVQSKINFTAPAPFLGMGFHKGKAELVFGRNGRVLGHIFTITDTAIMRTYDLPNFYNRICEITQVFVEDNTWKFLTQTNYYRHNDVWIILDTSRKSNYLIWDERGVYPEYPGMIKIHRNTALNIMDYSPSKIVPLLPQPDSVLIFENRKLKLIKPVNHKSVYYAHAEINKDSTTWSISSYDTTGIESGFMTSNPYLGNPETNIPWVRDEGAFHFLLPDSRSKQIFFSIDEYPAALISIPDKRYLLIGSELDYTILDHSGISLKRRNFISTLHSSIFRFYPEKRKILEVEVPEFGAIRYFIMLYGLFPLWLLSLIINWLIKILKKKPKFSVRENQLPFYLRLFPGSIIFIVFFALSIVKLLHDFSIF